LRVIAFVFTLAACQRVRAQRDASAVATISNGAVVSILVSDGGSGYSAPPGVTFVGGGGTGATASAELLEGMVTNISIQAAGSGYASAPFVAIDPPPSPVTPPTLSISMVPKLLIGGQPWAVQKVEYKNSFGDTNQWFSLTNVVWRDVPYVLVDTNAPPGSRFYRVVTVAAPGPDPARWAWINPNTFTMGSPATEYDRSGDESPQTEVTLSNGFWMERFEVTQGEYLAITGTNNSTFNGDSNQPVEQVTWFDAYNYCTLLTEQEQAAGRIPAGYVYRLPTEAEWECAARAGTTNRFPFGDDHDYSNLLNYAWFSTNSAQTTHDVGGKLANPWGIFDMSGNIWEWCADFYGAYPGGSITDPTGPTSGANRVMRGGSIFFSGGDCRPAARNYNPPDFKSHGIGIRVVLGRPLNMN
jgi:formylglycine-generating enzyme required for sulfatase activity